MSNNQTRRTTKARASMNLNISTINSFSNVGKVRHNVSLNVTPSGAGVAADSKTIYSFLSLIHPFILESFSVVPQPPPDILSPSQYEEKLKESKDLFTKSKTIFLKHFTQEDRKK